MGLDGLISQATAQKISRIAALGAKRTAEPEAALTAAQIEQASAGGLDRLRAFNQDLRVQSPQLLRQKYARMDANAFAFDRGDDRGYYQWMHAAEGDRMAEGPYTIISGDQHMANMGTVERGKQVSWGPNDFDESYVGSPRLDLRRFSESIDQVGQGLKLNEKNRMKLIAQFADSYHETLSQIAKTGHAKEPAAPSVLAQYMKAPTTAQTQRWIDHLAPAKNGKRAFARSATTTSVSPKLDQDVRTAFEGYRRALPAAQQKQLADYQISDVVSAVAGVGSVGRARYRVLLTASKKPPMAFEVKEEVPAAASPFMPFENPFGSEAERVVTLNRVADPKVSPFLGTARLPRTDALASPSFMVRKLTPSKASLDLTALTPTQLQQVVTYEGKKLAMMHAQGQAIGLASPKDLLGSLGSKQQLGQALQQYGRAFAQGNQQMYDQFHRALKGNPTLS